MYLLLWIILNFAIACQFGLGFAFLIVGNLKAFNSYIEIFKVDKPNRIDKWILHAIYLCFISISHISYKSLERRFPFFIVKLLYGTGLLVSIFIYLVVLALLDISGFLNLIEG